MLSEVSDLLDENTTVMTSAAVTVNPPKVHVFDDNLVMLLKNLNALVLYRLVYSLMYLYTVWVIRTKCELEIAGNWPSSFFFHVACLEFEVNKHAKVERDNLAILTEQALSKMDSFRSIFLQDTGVIPS